MHIQEAAETNLNDVLLTEDQDMARALNEFFTSVFTKEELENLPRLSPPSTELLNSIVVTEELVNKELDKLKPNKAAGADEIYPRILKECHSEVSNPLCLIFNKSLKESKVPSDWKKVSVTPIFKKGSKKEAGNYRLVSLTPIPGKLLESIIKKQMVRHLEENNLLLSSQHGFLYGRSCLTNLLEYLEYITSEIDNKKPVDVVYLDFSKAFDKVAHQRLILKLQNIGFGSTVCKWIVDWLKNRKQRVTFTCSQLVRHSLSD